jgi:hypothetical protein
VSDQADYVGRLNPGLLQRDDEHRDLFQYFFQLEDALGVLDVAYQKLGGVRLKAEDIRIGYDAAQFPRMVDYTYTVNLVLAHLVDGLKKVIFLVYRNEGRAHDTFRRDLSGVCPDKDDLVAKVLVGDYPHRVVTGNDDDARDVLLEHLFRDHGGSILFRGGLHPFLAKLSGLYEEDVGLFHKLSFSAGK